MDITFDFRFEKNEFKIATNQSLNLSPRMSIRGLFLFNSLSRKQASSSIADSLCKFPLPVHQFAVLHTHAAI